MDYRIDKRDWSDWVFAACALAGVLLVTWLAFAVAQPAGAEAEAERPLTASSER